MDTSSRKSLLWQVAGVLFYLAGMILFLVVAVTAYLAEPEHSLENLTSADMTLILVSIVLLVVGGIINWKYGGAMGTSLWTTGSTHDRGPDQSKLEELGYRMPTDEEQPETTDGTDDARVTAAGTVLRKDTVRCPDCGTENDRAFSYCRNCSSELPD